MVPLPRPLLWLLPGLRRLPPTTQVRTCSSNCKPLGIVLLFALGPSSEYSTTLDTWPWPRFSRPPSYPLALSRPGQYNKTTGSHVSDRLPFFLDQPIAAPHLVLPLPAPQSLAATSFFPLLPPPAYMSLSTMPQAQRNASRRWWPP